MNDYYFHAKRPLKWLEPLFDEMRKCIDLYGDAAEWNDLAYFYNERATISIMAGAAWRLNWIALEEFREWKTRKPSLKKKKETTDGGWGRVDLYVWDCEKTNREMCFEAKQRFPKSGTRINTLFKALDSAKEDAEKLEGYNSRSGLLFICPRLSQGKTVLSECEKITDDLKQMKPELLTWYFPKRARLDDSQRSRTFEAVDGGHFAYPGIITILAPVRASKH